jgi:Matrixin
MSKRFLVAAVVAAALIALSTQPRAYLASGHRWPTADVPFYVNPVNQDVSQNAAITALQTAASAWSAQTGADVNVHYVGTTTGTTVTNNHKNEIFFRNDANGATAAVTYFYWGADGKLMDADMMFFDGGFKFFTGQSGCVNGQYLEDIATHEFGHFIGFGHSADSTATMYPYFYGACGQTWRYLAQDDINAALFAYPATATPGAPSAPASAVASLGPAPTVNVAWQDTSSNETGFIVERSIGGVNFATVGQPGANVKSFLDATTVAGTAYQYRVRAFNATGSSAPSNVASIQTAAAASVLAAPKVYKPANGAKNVTKATASGYYVRWYAVAGATSYDVYFGTSSTPSKIATVVPPAGVSAYVAGTMFQGVTWGSKKTYYWKIVAKNAGGSTSSPVWKFSTN